VFVLVACAGSSEPAQPRANTTTKPTAEPRRPTAPAASTPPTCAEWRYALTGGSFEPTLDVTAATLVSAWRRGDIEASAETVTTLEPLLGPPGKARPNRTWSIVPAHTLDPSRNVIAVDGKHPLDSASGVLTVQRCGPDVIARNIDPAQMTTLVMSGTTALTGRTAKRIDDRGIADTIRYIKPFFASADLVHISNEVAFVKNCNPATGQQALVFCSREHYVDLLAALGVDIIELTGSHLKDYGSTPLKRTIRMYEKRGWKWYGGGRTQIEATEPRIVEHHGHRFAFVGCNAVAWWIKAISTGLGVASCDWARMTWQLRDLRKQGYIPIATVQHRELRTHAPPPDLVADLRRLAEAGAAVVIGSQAHVAHPWDMHYGAYIHYGPGNILFAQYRDEQRDATVDKLYFHAGKLLSVSHLYTRTEHGRPRLLRDDERSMFLGELSAAAAAIAAPDPAGTPSNVNASAVRPDALVAHGCNQRVTIDLDARTVTVLGKRYATDHDIATFMRAKYRLAAITIDAPAAIERCHSLKRRRKRTSGR
jgi:poly-gamma-glutamate capsule biosynthesis protein CapA/YwtB (metallophosphatase superfamily)